MKNAWHVLAREYLENVRTKAFLIGIFLTPLWFGAVFLVPLLAEGAERERQRVAVVDETGVLAQEVKHALETPRPDSTGRYDVEIHPADGAWTPDGDEPSRVDALRAQAAEGELIVLLLTPPLLEKRAPREGEHASELVGPISVGAVEMGSEIQMRVTEIVNRRLVQREGIPEDVAQRLLGPAVRYQPIDREGRTGGLAAAMAPLGFMLLLFMGIVGISQMLVNSTLEEKANRIYELLLSSVSSMELMTGKLLGICAVGLTLLCLWGGGGLAAAAAQGVGDIVSGGQIGLLLLYYLLGFFLIASLMLAVGSACNTLKEAQNLMAPLSLMLAFPIFLALIVLRDPNGVVATVTSFIPPFTPFVMMARIGGVPGPPGWQILASLLLLALSTWFALRLAARVFRVGILLYGQPPRLVEILRWLRQS